MGFKKQIIVYTKTQTLIISQKLLLLSIRDLDQSISEGWFTIRAPLNLKNLRKKFPTSPPPSASAQPRITLTVKVGNSRNANLSYGNLPSLLQIYALRQNAFHWLLNFCWPIEMLLRSDSSYFYM